MFPLPAEIIALLANFAACFDQRVWDHAVILVIGAILTPGKRTVTAALRIMGLSDEHFINYHRVLSRATWSGLALSRILLGVLVTLLLSANAPIVVVIDDTLERRRGAEIKANGVFRDAVRSSEKQVVTCFGLRWVCTMLLVPLPWATRPWALPCLTVSAPSERTQTQRGKRHKSCVDWARQMLKQVYRWSAARPLVLLADGGYAAVALGLACGALPQPITLVTRLRLDAALYDPPPPPQPHRKGGAAERRASTVLENPCGEGTDDLGKLRKFSGITARAARCNSCRARCCGTRPANVRCRSAGSWRATHRVNCATKRFSAPTRPRRK